MSKVPTAPWNNTFYSNLKVILHVVMDAPSPAWPMKEQRHDLSRIRTVADADAILDFLPSSTLKVGAATARMLVADSAKSCA
ncbi:hypothetical protein RRF57_003558 [Xylaria bambusicola]|uniref:Uncharacterized protein n=1 Tax=Xylaria bambusicola TaxID=326684 RepID=A0AAN7UHN8_9PEZI